MKWNQDYFDMFAALNTANVRYLIVGAYAVGFHVEPRTTKDIDLWVEASFENAQQLYKALAEFGAPLENVVVADFCNPEMVFQIGVPPNRIDILMGLEGITFDEAWQSRVEAQYDGQRVFMIGREELIQVKKLAGWPQDVEDVKALEDVKKIKRPK
ncbi:MAG: hypothetical protein AAB354_00915 [candidate division KSB1 bacterium]